MSYAPQRQSTLKLIHVAISHALCTDLEMSALIQEPVSDPIFHT